MLHRTLFAAALLGFLGFAGPEAMAKELPLRGSAPAPTTVSCPELETQVAAAERLITESQKMKDLYASLGKTATGPRALQNAVEKALKDWYKSNPSSFEKIDGESEIIVSGEYDVCSGKIIKGQSFCSMKSVPKPWCEWLDLQAEAHENAHANYWKAHEKNRKTYCNNYYQDHKQMAQWDAESEVSAWDASLKSLKKNVDKAKKERSECFTAPAKDVGGGGGGRTKKTLHDAVMETPEGRSGGGGYRNCNWNCWSEHVGNQVIEVRCRCN